MTILMIQHLTKFDSLGGVFARPAEQYPLVFGGVWLWETYPYALPTFVAGGLVLSSALTSIFFLNETLARKQPGQDNNEPPMTTIQVLKAPGVPIVLTIMGHTAILGLMFTAILPVFMYTSVPSGGFGFSDQRIALFLAVGGGSQALWMLLAFPYLQRTFGTGTIMRACAICWAFLMAAYPIFNESLRNGWKTAFWIVGPIFVMIGSGVAMGFSEAISFPSTHIQLMSN